MIPIRKNITSEEYSTRVTYGKTIEKYILDELKKNDMVIQESSEYEDMHSKIDGYIVNEKGLRIPLQIKYRETGDDIIFETTFLDKYDINHKLTTRRISPQMIMNGRDMIGLSSIYACLSQDGKSIWICDTNAIKACAKTMASRLIVMHLESGRTFYIDKEGEIKITTDQSSKRRKIMFFANPQTFANRTIVLSESLWTRKPLPSPKTSPKQNGSASTLVLPEIESKSILPASAVWGKKV
jgi:hypothetical protein